jgi:hypothetical protein
VTLGLAIAIVAVSVLAASAAMLLLRTRAKEGGAFSDSDRASSVFALLGVGFTIFVGFVIFLDFEAYSDAKHDGEAEAQATLQQYENAHLFDRTEAHGLEGELICYARAVTRLEWPRMERGTGRSPAVELWDKKLESRLRQAVVKDPKATTAFAYWLQQNEERERARDGRLQEARHPLPPLLWLVIAITGALVICYVLLYADPSEWALAQVAQAASVTAIVVASILLVIALNSPYGGSGAIRPLDMRQALGRMPASGVGTVPCDLNGVSRQAS